MNGDVEVPAELRRVHAKLLTMLTHIDQISECNGLPYFLAFGSALGAVRDQAIIPWDTDVDVVVPAHTYAALVDALRERLPAEFAVMSPSQQPDYEHLFSRVCVAGLDHNLIHVDLFPAAGASPSVLGRWFEVRLTKALNTAFMIKRAKPFKRYHYDRRKAIAAVLLKTLLAPVQDTWMLALFEWLMYRRPVSSQQLAYNPCGSYLDREVFDVVHLRPGTIGWLDGRQFPLPHAPEEYLTRLYGNFRAAPPVEEQKAALAFFIQHKEPQLRGVVET